MRTKHKRIATAVAGLVGMLGSMLAAAPAQAAPASLNLSQVNETTSRSTPVGPYTTKFGVAIELRAGWYQGFQYGWARVSPGSRWQTDDVIWLRILQNGSWSWVHGTRNEGSLTSTHTFAQITLSDPNYKFAACLWRGNDYDCTAAW